MKTLEFNTEINAPANIVWRVLWNDETYRKWTAVFSNDSHAESDWKEGSYIKFLDDKGDGLYSRIMKKIDNAEMHYEHLAELKNFEPDYDSEETKQWKGAKETYSLKQKGQTTSLHISMDIADKYADSFKESFENCIEKIKELSEVQV